MFSLRFISRRSFSSIEIKLSDILKQKFGVNSIEYLKAIDLEKKDTELQKRNCELGAVASRGVIEACEISYNFTGNRFTKWSNILKSDKILFNNLKQQCGNNIDAKITSLYRRLSMDIHGYSVMEHLQVPANLSEEMQSIIIEIYKHTKERGVNLDLVKVKKEGFKSALQDYENNEIFDWEEFSEESAKNFKNLT